MSTERWDVPFFETKSVHPRAWAQFTAVHFWPEKIVLELRTDLGETCSDILRGESFEEEFRGSEQGGPNFPLEIREGRGGFPSEGAGRTGFGRVFRRGVGEQLFFLFGDEMSHQEFSFEIGECRKLAGFNGDGDLTQILNRGYLSQKGLFPPFHGFSRCSSGPSTEVNRAQNPETPKKAEKSQKSLPRGVRNPWPRTPKKVPKKVRKVKKIGWLWTIFLTFRTFLGTFWGVRGQGSRTPLGRLFWDFSGFRGFGFCRWSRRSQ